MNKFVLSAIAICLLGALIISGFVFFGSDQKIPDGGESGEAAEMLRNEIENAVNINDWNSLAAVEFSLKLNQNHHFVDMKRGLTEVRFGNKDEKYIVQYDTKGNADAYRNNVRLSGEDLKYAYGMAKSYNSMDFFWLNPFAYLRDGTILKKIGNQALLVTFKNRNNETYLIVTDKTKRPTHWKMWTDTIPVKGMEASFDGWQKVKNCSAWVSLEHKNDFQEIIFTDVVGYDAYPPQDQKDRFLNFAAGASRISGD